MSSNNTLDTAQAGPQYTFSPPTAKSHSDEPAEGDCAPTPEPDLPKPEKQKFLEETIAPLVKQLHELCNAHQIAFVANFYAGDGSDKKNATGLFSCVLVEEWGTPDSFYVASRILQGEPLPKQVLIALMMQSGVPVFSATSPVQATDAAPADAPTTAPAKPSTPPIAGGRLA